MEFLLMLQQCSETQVQRPLLPLMGLSDSPTFIFFCVRGLFKKI